MTESKQVPKRWSMYHFYGIRQREDMQAIADFHRLIKASLILDKLIKEIKK